MTRFPKCILENPGTQGEPYRRTMQSHTFWKCGILLLNWRNAIYINWGEWDTVSQIYFTTNPLEHSTEACEAYCTLFWTPAKKSPSQLHHIGRPHLLQSPEGHHIQHLTVVSLVSTFPFLLFPSAFPPPPHSEDTLQKVSHCCLLSIETLSTKCPVQAGPRWGL